MFYFFFSNFRGPWALLTYEALKMQIWVLVSNRPSFSFKQKSSRMWKSKQHYQTRLDLNILRLLARSPASRYAILTDEIRYSAHRRKIANLLHSFRATSGPKSKNRISNILRQIKYKVVNLSPGKPWL